VNKPDTLCIDGFYLGEEVKELNYIESIENSDIYVVVDAPA